ncbi:MAG: aminopeptidase P family protein [Deltaproteobacteria bacterium]|nr:aminopeptidase P family protein [Deltaproteobacteria bacterium]
MRALTQFIVDIPTRNPDLFYLCRLPIPDPVVFFRHRNRSHLILSDLEFDGARRQATVDDVLSLRPYAQKAKARHGAMGHAEIILEVCHERKIRRIEMPSTTAAGIVDRLRAAHLQVTLRPVPFCPQRLIKSPTELQAIRQAMRATFRAMGVVEMTLQQTRIRRDHQLELHGEIVTAERLKIIAGTALIDEGYSAPEGMIIAGGHDSCEPHNQGSGPLHAHTSIVVDLFPRSNTDYFFGDASRTFCRGKAPPALAQLYQTVLAAQQWAIKEIRPGVDGAAIHRGIQKRFSAAGYPTGEKEGRREGFMHGTGHGLGLALHEEPLRIGPLPCRLRAGHVVTVEPGLYYRAIGGVRIEDVVVVTRTGGQLLARYPRRLEIL